MRVQWRRSDVSPVERVLGLLEGVVRRGDGYMALCPAHDDRTPSLSIREGDDGRVLLHCFGGCEPERVVAALGLGLADLYPMGPPGRGTPRVVAEYPYRDETGALLYVVERREPKAFRQRRPDGHGGWLWNLDGARRVLYRLPALVAADPLEAVFLVEGEKDADALAALGLVATTSPLGAGKWRD